MQIKLPTLLDCYITSKIGKGWSPKTLIGMRSVLGRLIRFLEQREHSLRLEDLTIDDGRAYLATLQG